ncbi:MAG: L-threonylcarbamoyladenylate synthase [Bacteroidota bacterium]
MAIITKDIFSAKRILDAGELVAIPTETVYGLAANGTDPLALQKIFEAKGRPVNNPLILHFCHLNAIEPYVGELPEVAKLLASAFWPGPLTLLLPKSNKVPEIVTAGNNRVAVRVPDHSLTLHLLEQLGYPLAAPSANPSGYISPTQPTHVQQQLGKKIPMILDGGPCQSGIESTILGWDEDSLPVIYRPGAITAKEIGTALGVTPQIKKENTVLLAPGMSSSHYAPKTPTIATTSIREELERNRGKKIGLITLTSGYEDNDSITEQCILSPQGSLEEMGRKLYAAMYELDHMDLDVIVIEFTTGQGLGKAINDRLKRSSTQ